jgi:hypothetical protein
MSAKAKKPKPSNVVDLATFREARTTSPSTSQESPPPPRWTHVDGAMWCLTQYDSLPEVADLLNEWEVNFLEDMAQQKRPATHRQVRCINRIILMINGMLWEQECRDGSNNTPAA